MSGFLEQMAEASRARVHQARQEQPEEALEQRVAALPPPSPLRRGGGFDLIAELKLRSPAAGPLGSAAQDISARVAAYAAGGACAVSVLTEPSRFDGSLEHLRRASAALEPHGVPALRKDFLVERYQLYEARLAGAAGVLLILRMLPRALTEDLLACARELQLFVLLEAFDAADMALMRELVEAHAHRQSLLAGLNCRDLDTLQVVPGRLLEGLPQLPRQVPRVAESGVRSPVDARTLAAAGYELALVGSALMQGEDARALTAVLLNAGRTARGQH